MQSHSNHSNRVSNTKGNPEEPPSVDSTRWNHQGERKRFTLEGLHDRVVSEVVKEEITLDDHDRIATVQG